MTRKLRKKYSWPSSCCSVSVFRFPNRLMWGLRCAGRNIYRTLLRHRCDVSSYETNVQKIKCNSYTRGPWR